MFSKETPIIGSITGPWSASPSHAGTGFSWSSLACSPLSNMSNRSFLPEKVVDGAVNPEPGWLGADSSEDSLLGKRLI